MILTWLPWVLVCMFLVLATFVLYIDKRKKALAYHVKVKFAHGIKVKLVLNDSQWEQFKAWLNQVDGKFEIGDDSQLVVLDRGFLVSVEMQRK